MLAALPVAVAARFFFQRRAVAIAAAAAVLAATAAVLPLLDAVVWPLVGGEFLTLIVIDAAKTALLPPTLAWALGRLSLHAPPASH